LAGLVGALTGFASTFVLVLAGLRALGATPGAALLIAAHVTTHNFGAAVGAFIVCGLMIAITGLWPALTRAITRIPTPIASAMLAGILFPICLAPIEASVTLPLLALPIVLVWLVLYGLAPRWAVPGALVIVSLGIPLFLVTMAGQNVPGFVVLKNVGYENPPARPILVGSGLLSAAGALFGAHVSNLAALSAAIMAGPDSHSDHSKRWIATVTGGAVYVFLGLAAGLAASLVQVTPPLLITTVAGLAMFNPFLGAVAASLDDPANRIVAIITFLVVASGIVLVGIGSPFWGLLVGGIVMLWLTFGRRGLRKSPPQRGEDVSRKDVTRAT
jgi:benzoate membrane transport protein